MTPNFFTAYIKYLKRSNVSGIMNKLVSLTIFIALVSSFFISCTTKEKFSANELQKDVQIEETNKDVKNEETYIQGVPSSVLTKYEEVETVYKRSLGARISSCVKDNEKVFVVSGSGGFTGVGFYFTDGGVELGNSSWTDEIDPNHPPPKPPVNIQEYECNTIRESEQFVKP